MSVMLNLGAGPVREASERQARLNLSALLREIGLLERGVRVPSPSYEGGGRWEYRLRLGRRVCYVAMPGCPLAVLQARELSQPRIYVDGSSWYWHFATGSVREALTGEGEES